MVTGGRSEASQLFHQAWPWMLELCPQLADLQTCGKSYKLRWINNLMPDLKRRLFSKSKVSSAMLGKSKLDASEKEILLKEVKLSKARMKQAEQVSEKWRAISDGKCKRHSLRSILVNFD
ncbi:polyamine-modulated factor 1-binding protein 1 [Senna tora]|uniref:Polyamine-modulated factor 1-binding protein 1 n=1 Tax=Senna tora TaxID=362788 RepID=A0A834TJ19_9FABA|nr:polyamine-modulated factor 1-binding protein 1 [Senna tora]